MAQQEENSEIMQLCGAIARDQNLIFIKWRALKSTNQIADTVANRFQVQFHVKAFKL
jgi:hypothetical protein